MADAWHKGLETWRLVTNALAQPVPDTATVSNQVAQLQGHLRFLTNRTARFVPDQKLQLLALCRDALQLLDVLPRDPAAERPAHLMEIAERLENIGRLYPGDALIPNSPASLTMSGLPAPTIRPRILEAPVVPGQPTKVRLRLETPAGKPVRASSLVAHQEALLHALVLDETFADYQHEHPVTNAAPGEFEFTFTPKTAGPYRVWFNLISLPMSLEEFPWQDLSSNVPAPKITRTPRAEANDGRSKVVLRWPAGPPRAGRKTVAEFQFTDEAGQPRQDLDLIMGAFGHLVGFNEDFRTPLHVHPDPVPIGFETKNAGPVLKFSLIPPKSGTWRLFLQTAHAGKTYTSDFTVEVAPQ